MHEHSPWADRLAAVVSSTSAFRTGSTKARIAQSVSAGEVVPGDLIIGTQELLTADTVVSLIKTAAPSLDCTHAGWGSERLHLLTCTGPTGALSQADTWRAAQAISLPPGLFVEPTAVVHATRTPNDPKYIAQWHYRTMNLPAAWDLTTGSASVVVAVVDTGIGDHEDLNANILPGYDMISDATMAGDSDGRDSNPADVFGDDDPRTTGSSWHGTHTAGTIAAVSNNALGVAGVAWGSRVVPVRALGKGGQGTNLDIAAAITWASGGTVPGVTANAHPAQVISMSLTGKGAASAAYQTVIDAAATRGAVIVVAAGNEGLDTASSTPCNQNNVICVAATDQRGQRTSYSNFGAEVTVAGPGGDTSRDDDSDGSPDGVLSTIGGSRYELMMGTSMATPHVAGLVALMKSLKPSLTVADVKAAFAKASTPISNCATGCGTGLIDAAAALRAIQSGGTPTGPGSLTTSVSAITLTDTSGPQTVLLSNPGGSPITVDLSCSGATLQWTKPTSIAAGARVSVTVSYAASITQDLDVSCTFIPSQGSSVPLAVHLRTARAAPKTAVMLLYEDAAGKTQIAAEVAADAAGLYRLTASPGSYLLVAASDDNGDGTWENGEGLGIWPSIDSPAILTLTAGANITNANFGVAPQKTAKAIGGPCASDAECDTGQFCVLDAAWVGGYCTQDCSATACPTGSSCVADDTGSVMACFATCGALGTQSTCRASYTCLNVGLPSGGVCAPQ